VPYRLPTADQSAAELKRQIVQEREGEPFVVFRDGSGSQHLVSLASRNRIVVGRNPGSDVTISGDEAVSRLHAELIRVGGSWVVTDNGLSTNGTFVNDDRVHARRRLSDRDLIVVGGTGLLFRDPSDVSRPARPTLRTDESTPPLAAAQRRVLVALCRPLAIGGSSSRFPATNQEIAAELNLSIGGVKANLTQLYEKFGVDGLAQNEKRLVLAETVLQAGVVQPSELEQSGPG
jgi:pSer/pThr/pTyr-binding forkhead associated (FHA) protein